MGRTRVKTLLIVGFIIGIVAVPVLAATFPSDEAGQVSDGVPFGAPSGTNITLDGDTNVKLESDELFPSSDTVALTTEAGNATFTSSGTSYATIHKDNITGTETYLSQIDAQTDLTMNPEDKAKATIGGNIQTFGYKTTALDDGTYDFQYGGPSGTSTITLNDVPGDTQIGAIDQGTNTVLDVSTSDSSGSVTFTVDNSDHQVALQTSDGGPTLSNPNNPTVQHKEDQTLEIDLSDPDIPDDNVSLEWYVDGSKRDTTYHKSDGTKSVTVGPLSDGDHDWYVVATDSYGQTDTSTTQTLTVDHYDPKISNINPQGDLDFEPSQISADVDDLDFASGNDGDSITVDIDLDGSQIDSQTISSNSTVSTSMPSSGQTGGSHTITYEATDSYGQTTTETVSYNVPDVLSIRNELNHSELIPADGEVTFFGETEIFTRTAPDGTVNLTGLPVNQDFIVSVEPTDGNFTSRTIYLEGIYEQESVYVLNESAVNTITSRFVLEDPTGNYDAESLLKIQKPINASGTTTWQTIVSDEFGAEGVTGTLETDQRYRLVVANNGDEQIVGPYRSDTGETVTVEPGTPTINLSVGKQGWETDAVLDNTTLTYGYSDPNQKTDQVIVYIHERGNKSNKLQPNETYLDLGNFSAQSTLTTDEKTKEWVVNFVIDRDGDSFTVKEIVSNQKDLTPPLGEGWRMMIGVGMLILFAGTFSVLNATVGAVIVSLTGGVLWYIGWLGGATSGIAIAVAIFISGIIHFASKSR